MGTFKKQERKKTIDPKNQDLERCYINGLIAHILLAIGNDNHFLKTCYYNGYGLDIICSADGEFIVYFNGKKVYSDRIFDRGSWENLLFELANATDAIKAGQMRKIVKEEKKKAMQRKIFDSIRKVTIGDSEIDVDSTTKIITKEKLTGVYGEYCDGVSCKIYYNGKLVFNVNVYLYKGNYEYTYGVYERGEWEKKVKEYLSLFDSEEIRKEIDEKLVSDGIKKIRKIG